MKLFFTTILSIVFGFAIGQEFTLTEQFAGEEESVTARSMGTAGAFSSVGADFSNATANPAGIAFFRKKEIGLGLGYQHRNMSSVFLNQEDEGKSSVFRLNNIGFAYSDLQTEWINDSLVVKRKGLVSWALTAGMNQKADYEENIGYSEMNPNSSLLSSYVESANANASTNFSNLNAFELQAYNTNLLETTNIGNTIQYSSPYTGGQLMQDGEIERLGARRDFFISGGLNFDNKLYVGATIDIPWISYTETKNYTETDENNVYSSFNAFSLNEQREYDGVGGALSLGAIYRFSDYFRAGVNIKSPTIIDFTQYTTIRTSSDLSTGFNEERDDYEDSYLMYLPWKTGLQLVASHPQYGLLSLEADYIDYSTNSITYNDDEFGDFDDYEQSFKDDLDYYYKGTLNVRGGLELRLQRNIRLRGGVGYYGSPYEREEDELGADYSKLTLGLGIGYRYVPSNLTFDLGFNRNTTGEFNSAYLLNNIPNSIVTDKTTYLFRLNVSKRFNQ